MRARLRATCARRELPHAIAIDSQDRVFAANRANGRIQVFDTDGIYLDESMHFGSPSGFFLTPNDVLWVAHSLGIYASNTRNGEIMLSVHHEDLAADASNIEDVAADARGTIYAGLAGPPHRIGSCRSNLRGEVGTHLGEH